MKTQQQDKVVVTVDISSEALTAYLAFAASVRKDFSALKAARDAAVKSIAETFRAAWDKSARRDSKKVPGLKKELSAALKAAGVIELEKDVVKSVFPKAHKEAQKLNQDKADLLFPVVATLSAALKAAGITTSEERELALKYLISKTDTSVR